MDRKEQVTQRPGRIAAFEQVAKVVLVPERLGHLLSVDDQVLGVQPVADERLARGRFTLGDLVLVMREHVVDAAAVDVESLTQVFHAHGGTFEVPARPARPPGRLPTGLTRFGSLPEDEIADVILTVIVTGDPLTLPNLGEVNAGEAPIVGIGGDAEEHRVLLHIGVASLDQTLDHRDHFADMPGGTGILVGRESVQHSHVAMEGFDERGGEFVEGTTRFGGALDDLVVDVGQIHHVGDGIAEELERPTQQILEQECP